MDPRRLKRWLIVAAVLYLLFPRDLVPDFLGRGLGLVDDLALVVGMIWFYRRKLREIAARGPDGPAANRAREREREEPRQDPGGRAAGGPADDTPPDPYAVLGVPRSASAEEIRAAYRARMREYHPDKVAHLGPDLQELAHRKTLEIQGAFEKLRG